MTCAIVAWGASSSLGEGEQAFRSGDRAITRVARDEELAAAGLARPFCARVAGMTSGGRDRASVLFERALADCARGLDTALPGWRGRRVGLAIGTSSGGMRTFESAKNLEDHPLPLEATYLGPVLAAERPCAFEPFSLVLGACASSTIAMGVARAWLLDDACDIALAGGFDALGVFVASGFEVLRATSAVAGPRPFRIGRDGLALGEGAAVLALARPHDVVATGVAHAYVTGFGATCDATHLTAPDRTGRGLANAMRDALRVAGIDAAKCGLVSAHGTATPFNDESESKAIEAVYADGERPTVHAFKGTIGHTLGAAGALETLAAVDAMSRGALPPSYGEGDIIPGVRVLDAAERRTTSAAIKLSSAFGGTNAALVVETKASSATPDTKPKREAWISRAVSIVDGALPTAAELAKRTGYAEDRIARADDLVRLTLAAIAKLEERVGSVAGAGIVVGHGLATIETNVAYLARIRSSGAARAEPRRFPFTTPNASSGEAAIAFGLTGPSFAVGGGAHGGIEALRIAVDLVRDGVSDRIVVVAADDAREYARIAAPGTTTGAVALLVTKEKAEGRVLDVRVRLEHERMPDGLVAESAMHAHVALLPLSAESPAESVEAALPWGGFAKASVFWV